MKLLSLLFCIGIANAEYLLVHPRYMEAGKESSVCLTLKSMTPDSSTGQLTIQYTRNDPFFRNFSVAETFQFVINQEDIHVCNAVTPPSKPGSYEVLITVTVDNLDQRMTLVDNEKAGEMQVQRADLITLIQTDKGIYKPGQTVKIRAITVNYDLMFQTDFSLITVESPNGLRMAQWDDIKPVNGLVSLKMPLSTDPVLGTWLIKAVTKHGQYVRETFKVEEYVLPKYEVTITPPAYLLTTSRTISGTVCAKYTYGKPVRGYLSLSVCYKAFYSWNEDDRPCAVVHAQINGCYEFVVDSEDIHLGNKNYSTYGELKLNATVTEKETGVTLTGESEGPSLSLDALKLQLEDDSNNFFKPGFPYRGRVIVKNPDGSPAPGEEIEVTARPGYWRQDSFSKTFLSDDNGIIHFVMPDMAKEHGTWQISADAVVYKTDWRYNYNDYWYLPSTPHASSMIQKWNSPSNSYIYIPDVDMEVECDSELYLDVYYTTPPGPTYTFTAILQAGSVIKSTNIFTETSTENIIDIISVDSSQVLEKVVDSPKVLRKRAPQGTSFRVWQEVDPTFVPTPSNVTVHEGDLAVLKCHVERLGAKTVVWRKVDDDSPLTIGRSIFSSGDEWTLDHSKLSKTSSTWDLHIKNVRTDHAGVYECQVTAKQLITHHVTLNVLKQAVRTPTISIDGTKFVNKGYPIVLTCNATGVTRSPEEVDWFFEGNRIHSNDKRWDGRVEILKYVSENNHISKLIINQSRFEDKGSYVCRSSNLNVEGMFVHVLNQQVVLKSIPPTTKIPKPLTTDSDSDVFTETGSEKEEIAPKGERRKKKGVLPNPEDPTVEEPNVISMFKMPVYVTRDMSPDVSVLLYYVREDNEVVSTSINIKVKSCFGNKASMSFSKETVQPGESVNLSLGAAPASTCFVGMVDKSVNILGGYNQLTPAKVFENVRRVSRPPIWNNYYNQDLEYCKQKFPTERDYPASGYEYLSVTYKSEGVDAVQPFRDMNMLVLTDATLETRPCKREEYPVVFYMSMAMETVPLVGEAKQDPVKIRSLFPETWLWDMFQIGDEGHSTFELTVPDTITEWLGNTLCSHPEAGVGLTDLTRIIVFQPFFVSLNLPYSVIRGETVPLIVTVFNYLENCLTMSVVLRETEGYENPSGVAEANMCVCGGDSKSAKFYIIPTIIGEIDIEVVAFSVEDTGLCTNVVLSTEGVGVSDGVQRQLLVEAEGVPQEKAVSSFICLEESMVEKWTVKLDLPENLVPESDRAQVSVVGDVMGPTLSNLKNLLRMPYGCGEQNMASWSPNIYVLQYLNGTGQSTAKLEEEAKGYMAVGYQRQMKYRHSDYSYSAFGEQSYFGNPPNGSLWLTAFVVKSMAQSAHFISIDKYTIMDSISFIRGIQNDTGCFPQYGKVFSSYMKGGLADGDNPAGLTAFVLIALLETDFLDEPRVNMTIYKGFQCLNGFSMNDVDTYTLAIMSYAYSLADESFIPAGRMDEIFFEIEKRAKMEESGLKYWEREGHDEKDKETFTWYRAPSANIEMTAYILMNLMTYFKGNPDVVGQVLPIVQWITKQRNPYGGFSSTQDTVVALQALAKYATLTYSEGSNVIVEVNSGKITTFQVTDDNSLLYQSVPVYSTDGPVHIQTMGKGCVLVQVSMLYNVYEEDKSDGPAFDVSVDVHRIPNERSACDKRNIKVCASYLKSGGISNMAIIEVKMPSGWSPDSDSLKQVLGVARTEVDNGKVDLYFDELTSTHSCVVFKVQQDIEMNTKPSLVRVYDYYETAYEVTVPYSIETGCGTKEDIPKDNEGLDCTRVQCRVTVPPRLPELPSCPECPESMAIDDFKDAVCNAKAVYKAWVGRQGKYPIKLKTNLRSRKKEDFNDFVYYKMDTVCHCPIIEESKEMKAFIIVSDEETYDTRQKVIDFDSQVTILKYKKQWEREVRILSTRPKACKKLARLRRKAEKLRHKRIRNLKKNRRNRNNK